MKDRIVYKAVRRFALTPEDADNYRPAKGITVTAELSAIGDQAPYFAVTASIGNVAGGCLHEDCAKYWPDVQPLISLHLSTDDGRPMHSHANGWHWLAGACGGLDERWGPLTGSSAQTQDDCLRIFAEHCRITEEEARAIVWEVCEYGADVAVDVYPIVYNLNRVEKNQPEWLARENTAKCARATLCDAAKAAWAPIYDSMLPRWFQEAQAGIDLLKSLEAPQLASV